MVKRKSHSLINGSVKLRWYSLMLVAVVTFILFSNSYTAHVHNSMQATANFPEPILTTTSLPLKLSPNSDDKVLRETINISDFDLSRNETVTENAPDNMQSWTIRSGDTFSGILQRFGAYSSFGSILAHGKDMKPLMHLQTGKPLHLRIENNQLEELVYEYSTKKHFILQRDNTGYITEDRILPIENREIFAAAEIENSFYISAQKAGLPDEIIVETANILAWDIDFILDIRKGDTFSVLYIEEYLHGEKIGNGNIIGIKFINQGETYYAIAHTLENGNTGHYSLDGKNVKKPFLRSPLKFTRISSTFNPKRLHPIHKIVRPHRGVDYAAPTGTPIYAAGDGKIIYNGWKAGYGNTIVIRHAGVYSTLYAHLSRFSSAAKLNAKVEQGQIIGYVGMTGYATGPHLHYEFLVNSIHKNPLTVKLPDSTPLPGQQLQSFTQASVPIVKQLNTVSSIYADSSGHSE